MRETVPDIGDGFPPFSIPAPPRLGGAGFSPASVPESGIFTTFAGVIIKPEAAYSSKWRGILGFLGHPRRMPFFVQSLRFSAVCIILILKYLSLPPDIHQKTGSDMEAKTGQDKARRLLAVFAEGLLYFFGLAHNPIKTAGSARTRRSDADAMRQDWENVGNDIRMAYERYKAAQGK